MHRTGGKSLVESQLATNNRLIELVSLVTCILIKQSFDFSIDAIWTEHTGFLYLQSDELLKRTGIWQRGFTYQLRRREKYLEAFFY